MKQLLQRLANDPLIKQAESIKAMGVYPYFRAIESDQDTVVKMHGKNILMFGSNSYLGLTNHPKIKEASIAAIRKYGTGCAGSPYLNGTMDIHIELEEKLADFVGKEKAIVYSTGFQANIGAIPSLMSRRDDYIICDKLNHASIVTGCQLSPATTKRFKHNDMESLERLLNEIPFDKTKLIVIDGVFSMEGEIAPLPKIVELADKYNASVYVDEAHSLGVLGKEGRGVCNHFDMTDKVDVIMGTFSKSLAAIGGFVAADSETMNYIRHSSRSYIFSASISPAATASVIAALDVIKEEPERIAHLWEITNYALSSFRSLGFEIGATETPIIPLYVRNMEKTFLITAELYEKGVFINPVIPPACAADATLVRFALMATHTKEQIDCAVEILTKVFKHHGVIK
ncbi:MAG: aminotransferase class I/II-fold pyridoxal phosphate-dependent enzyme [Bacteroidales bacterium]|jgi:8-amino-7-oxononanoate synthase|nr:aminotransferase class I/II-fold pyridoxal phosphate-dependent enzyme [Bacteroidales bacterium]